MGPKDLITKQETEAIEEMTEGQYADYLTEELSDY